MKALSLSSGIKPRKFTLFSPIEQDWRPKPVQDNKLLEDISGRGRGIEWCVDKIVSVCKIIIHI